jgi:hypothetical protein
MARDRELAKVLQRLNNCGAPPAGMLLATIVSMLLVVLVNDMAGLGRSLCGRCRRGHCDQSWC